MILILILIPGHEQRAIVRIGQRARRDPRDAELPDRSPERELDVLHRAGFPPVLLHQSARVLQDSTPARARSHIHTFKVAK